MEYRVQCNLGPKIHSLPAVVLTSEPNPDPNVWGVPRLAEVHRIMESLGVPARVLQGPVNFTARYVNIKADDEHFTALVEAWSRAELNRLYRAWQYRHNVELQIAYWESKLWL